MKTKRLLTICMLVASVCSLQAQSFETATEAVENMGVGWNLGNALEANNNDGKPQGLDSETCWGQSYTRPELLKMMKEAGFGAIRVPVTWMNHMDSDGKVDAAWMARVHEVVDYVINQGLYCIVNVHHDTGDGDVHWLHASMTNYNNTKAKYEYLWQQIAEEFKDYDQKLLFEAYNEMLDKYNSWCFASYAAPGNYNATDAADAYKAINSYAQSFVTTVRHTGGNNAKRNLIVNTYGSCDGRGSWNSHLKEPLTEMKYPTDAAGAGHIIFQVHCYPNIAEEKSDGTIVNRSISSIKNEIDNMISLLKTNLVAKGGPVIIGEWGTSNVDKGAGKTDYDVRRELMFQFVDYFVQKTKANGIGTFYWMGLSDGSNRGLPAFNQPDLAKAILQGYYGSDYEPKLITRDDYKDIIKEVNYTANWGELNLYAGATLTTADYKGIVLELEELPSSGSLSFKIYPKAVTSTIKTTETTLNFNPTTHGTTIERITLQASAAGMTARIKNVYLIKKDDSRVSPDVSVFWGCNYTETGTLITSIGDVMRMNGKGTMGNELPIYNLHGQQVSNPRHGIFIQNGKKFVVR